jgi:nucleoside-diphosphate-sugar epimerase
VSERAVVFGCGYVGIRLIRALTREGCTVWGAAPTRDRFAEVREAGAEPYQADALSPASLRPLADLGPDVVFDLVRPQQLAADRYTTWGTRNVAQTFADAQPGALVHLSSTSVYDGRTSEWFDEASEVHPASAFGTARLESERIYLDAWLTHRFPVRICRAPAVYGPQRTLRHRLESGAFTRVDDEEQWVSRIHVDDLVVGLLAAWRRGSPGEVYLLCDDEPMTGREYAEMTAELLSLPLPAPFPREDIRQELGGGKIERRSALGRCCNRRMKEDLGVILRYPSVREGVPASLREEGAI